MRAWPAPIAALIFLVSRRVQMVKPGVGEMTCAFSRLTKKFSHAAFRPDLDGARWHCVHDLDTATALTAAESAHQAMAILREAPASGHRPWWRR